MKRISTLASLAAIVIAPLSSICFVTPSVQAQRVQPGLQVLSDRQPSHQSAATQATTDSGLRKSAHDQLEAIIERLDAINVNLGGKPQASPESSRLSGHDQLEAIIERLDAIDVNLGGKPRTAP